MKAIVGFFKQKWIVQFAGVGALCALIWFLAPKLAYGDRVPFESELNRLLAIIVVVAFWALYNLIQQSRSEKKERQMMADLAGPPVDPEQAAIENAQTKELDDLRIKFERAMQLLRETRAKNKRDKHHIYELPWYVIIGVPGCGKTTLLANSGLNFPLAGKLDQEGIQGVAGTRNCDWMFADEAIFLDTAGRYTSQDSHQAVDAAAWQGFLELIKKYRPRRPINGVLVATSISDLLEGSVEENQDQADNLRRRISDLFGILGNRFPIYMLFTKCDLVAGFNELFGRLSRDDRAQVWGETFRIKDADHFQGQLDQFLSNFSESLGRLSRWVFRRISEERDIQRRSMILDFPQQMAMLKPKIKNFLLQTFRSNPYDESSRSPLLRGVYFTSGTQEGTPIDQVMGKLASSYGLDRQHAPVFSGRGKSFFITRLLKAVIFPEAQLAGTNPRVERRRRLVQTAAYGTVVLLTTAMVMLWAVSYVRNKEAIAKIGSRIEKYQPAAGDISNWTASVKSLLDRLNIVDGAKDSYGPLAPWMGFGLNQGDKILSGVNLVYNKLLQHDYLPLVTSRLEQRIHALIGNSSGDDIAMLYELLKIYLMLGEPRQRLDAGLAGKRINNDYKHVFSREPGIRTQLAQLTKHLFRLPLEPVKLNVRLVDRARQTLNKQPLYAQIYAHIHSEAMVNHSLDFRLRDILPQNSERVIATIDGEELHEVTIAGLYTYEGYHRFFTQKGLSYIRQALKENWVTANYAADQESDLPRLYDDLQKLYFEAYEKKWRALINNIKIKNARGISQEIQILDILSGTDSPLRPLMASIEKHTTLYKASEENKPASQDNQDGNGQQPSNRAEQVLRKKTVSPHVLKLERQFKDIHFLVRQTGDAPPLLERLLGHVNGIRDYMMQVDSAAHNDEKALEIASERIRGGGASEQITTAQRDFARLPDPFKGWFQSLTSSSLNFTLAGAKSGLNRAWKTDVLPAYTAGLKGRYPIDAHGRYDVTFDDFTRFFMAGGTIDRFFRERLEQFVDTTRPRWRSRKVDGKALRISPDMLRQFQYAAKIRDTFFAGGASTPSVRFELKPLDLDENVLLFKINIEGQVAQYDHGPTQSHYFTWPGPEAGAGVRLTFRLINGQYISHTEEGQWAWFKILDRAVVGKMTRPDKFQVIFKVGSHKAHYELKTSSVHHPFRLAELKYFRCPEAF